MPSLNITIGPSGPVADVGVGISTARLHALKATTPPTAPPAPVMARLLIDTGASCTCVCQTIISQLNLQPTGQVAVMTPTTGGIPAQKDQYDVNLYFLFGQGAPSHTINTIPIICTDLSGQGIHGLLGRDVLEKGQLIYHGQLKICTLNF